MEWKRYYEEEGIESLSAQAPYYRYALEQLDAFITAGRGENEQITVVLGGLHPKATRPEHFEGMCSSLFRNPLDVVILDQNEQALKEIDRGRYSVFQAKIQMLPKEIGLVSLLVCDYTTDFMSDSQIREMNVTLPNLMDKNGVLALTIENPTVPTLSKVSDLVRFGVKTYPRGVNKIKRLLSNFKLILDARTANNNNLLVFVLKNAKISEFEGLSIGLFPDEGPFEEWIRLNQVSGQN